MSVPKKRISWGPSKVLEYYPHLKSSEDENSEMSSQDGRIIQAALNSQINATMQSAA